MTDEVDYEQIERRVLAHMSKELGAALSATISGPARKQRRTALRVRGRSFETVELDDDGNVIEPLRCTCGSRAVHNPRCPLAYICT